MHTARTLSTASLTVYVVLGLLRPGLQPCYVGRRGPRTYLFAHSDAHLHEAVLWWTRYLTLPEREYIRQAIGQPPIGQMVDPALMEARLGDALDVPGLRLPVARRPTLVPVEVPKQASPVARGRIDWSLYGD